MEKFVFIVAFFICSAITSGMGLKCYLQQCEKSGKDDVWSCFTKDDGNEQECDDACAESNQGNTLFRACSNQLPHEKPTKTESDGKICSEEIRMTRDGKEVKISNCHCKKPMCNNFTKLDKVKVMEQ